MNHRWLKPLGFVALAMTLVTASCDNGSINSPVAPEARVTTPSTSFSAPMTPQASIVDPSGYHIVPATNGPLISLSNVLGVLGGTLNLGGHKLVVPTGAVTAPTLFTMISLPTNSIQVHLSALQINLLGIIDIGGKGFLKPVSLSLSYDNAIGVTDPSHLRIAELKSDGTLGVILPVTVNATAKTITAQLPHFSSWIVVCN
jgi:hypothetical protein